MTKKEKIEKLQIELISVRSEYESFKAYHDRIVDELNKTVNELKEFIENTEIQNLKTLGEFDRVKYVAKNKYGDIFVFSKKPSKGINVWFPETGDRWVENITSQQAYALCGTEPRWDDTEPTPVISLITEPMDEQSKLVNNKVDISGLDWAKWVATHRNGGIYAHEALPTKKIIWWRPQPFTKLERITPEQAFVLCGRIPQWSDEESTPVKR